jgi:hypothetical protein
VGPECSGHALGDGRQCDLCALRGVECTYVFGIKNRDVVEGKNRVVVVTNVAERVQSRVGVVGDAKLFG